MKFQVNTKELTNKLNLLSGIISNNAALPILECYLIEVKGNLMNITVSDLENTMTTNVQVQGIEDGKTCIPYRIFLDTLKTLSNDNVKIEVKKDTVTISSDKGKYKMTAENSEDFPKSPLIKSDPITINSSELKKAINSTFFAISNDALRPAMTGLFFEFENDNLNLVGTDSSMLSKYSFKCNQLENNFIIPKKALSLLKNSLSESELLLNVNDTNACFQYDDITLYSRLVDSVFPKYQSIIPDNKNIIKIDKVSLLQSLKRVSLFSNKVTFSSTLNFKDNELEVSSRDLDYNSEAKESLICQKDGEDVELAFNSRKIIEMLQNIEETNIEIQIGNSMTAGIIKPNDNVLMLAMPMMIQ